MTAWGWEGGGYDNLLLFLGFLKYSGISWWWLHISMNIHILKPIEITHFEGVKSIGPQNKFQLLKKMIEYFHTVEVWVGPCLAQQHAAHVIP